jgi:hypothetical protein
MEYRREKDHCTRPPFMTSYSRILLPRYKRISAAHFLRIFGDFLRTLLSIQKYFNTYKLR